MYVLTKFTFHLKSNHFQNITCLLGQISVQILSLPLLCLFQFLLSSSPAVEIHEEVFGVAISGFLSVVYVWIVFNIHQLAIEWLAANDWLSPKVLEPKKLKLTHLKIFMGRNTKMTSMLFKEVVCVCFSRYFWLFL